MAETAILEATCELCDFKWRPFGYSSYNLPYDARVTCPKCHHIENMEWYDSETSKKKLQKKLGLDSSSEIITRLNDLEKKVELLEKELDIEKRKREISETELKAVKDWANTREKDFKNIEILAEEERERMKNNEGLE
jgi:uncharacterized Zn finger protein (UPF0148 family)